MLEDNFMNIKINGSNVKITEGMTVAINDKLNFLDKFFETEKAAPFLERRLSLFLPRLNDLLS